jgi:hypothetical protein
MRTSTKPFFLVGGVSFLFPTMMIRQIRLIVLVPDHRGILQIRQICLIVLVPDHRGIRRIRVILLVPDHRGILQIRMSLLIVILGHAIEEVEAIHG